MNANSLIDRIMNELKNKRPFAQKHYQDEPIIRPASSLNNYLPPEIASLKAYGQQLYNKNPFQEELIFLKQAQKAVDIVDNVPPIAPFFLTKPTYRTLSNERLRAYFSWRHQVRNGHFTDHPAFISIYANELIHLIGVDNAEEAFDRLATMYKASDLYDFCLEEALIDFYVYYQPDRSIDALPLDLTRNRQLAVLHDCQTADDDTLCEAVCAASTYRFEQSRFFKTHPDVSRKAIAAAYRLADSYYREHDPKSWFSQLFGDNVVIFYPFFRSFCFYEESPHADTVVELTPLLRFACENGVWYRIKGYTSERSSAALGNLMKQVDVCLRNAYHYPHPIKEPLIPEALQTAAQNAVCAATAPTPTAVTIDLSKLDAIRRAAEITCGRLLVDEEEEAPPPPPAPSPAPCNHTPLDDTAYAVLCCLLAGQDAAAVAREHHRMLSVVCDSINDAFFDHFGDSVIDFDGDTPCLIDEYVDELKGLISS